MNIHEYSTRKGYSMRILLDRGGVLVAGEMYVHECVLNGDFGTVLTFSRRGNRWRWVAVGRGRYQDRAVRLALGIERRAEA